MPSLKMPEQIQVMKINDIEYVKKEELDKALNFKLSEDKKETPKVINVNRFSSGKEEKILRALNEIFTGEGENGITEEDAVEKGAAVIDASNVCMIGGKSEEAKRILAHFINKDVERKEIPKWDFIEKEKKSSSARYSMEYINKIIKFFNLIGSDGIRISLNHDSPIQIEDNQFVFILAPRIEEEK